jgi:hypothetical protein
MNLHNRVGVRPTCKDCIGDHQMATPAKKLQSQRLKAKKLRVTLVALPMAGQVPNAVVVHSNVIHSSQTFVSERGIAFVALPYAGQVPDAVIVPTL